MSISSVVKCMSSMIRNLKDLGVIPGNAQIEFNLITDTVYEILITTKNEKISDEGLKVIRSYLAEELHEMIGLFISRRGQERNFDDWSNEVHQVVIELFDFD